MTRSALGTLLALGWLAACDPGSLAGGGENLFSGGSSTGNLVRNPGCEQDVSGWCGWRAKLTRTTSVAHSGLASCRVSCTRGRAYTIDDSPATVISPAAGEVYAAAVWVRSSRSVGKPIQLLLRQRGGSQPLSHASSGVVPLKRSWQKLQVTATIDAADRTSLELYVAQTAASTNDRFEVDDLSLVLVSGSPDQEAAGSDGSATEPAADSGVPPVPDSGVPPAPDSGVPLAPDSGPPPAADSGPPAPDSGPPPPPPTTKRPFNSSSPYNMPIPPNPKLDPNSSRAAMVNKAKPVMSLYYYSPRIYEVDGNTERRVKVSCTKPWGTCELEDATQNQAGGVPIPVGAKGAPAEDAHMVIWDIKNQISYDFWRYRYPNNSAPEGETSWGGLVSTAGNGVDSPGGRLGAGGSTGADIARLAGIIRVAEVKTGVIPHALVGPTTNSCNTFRWPALKSDGWSSRSDCVPEGARLQLDPSIDLDTVKNLRPIDRMVAKALQVYGFYNIDNGGSFNGSSTKWVVQFEVDPSSNGAKCPGVSQVYCAAGAAAEYDLFQGTLPDGSYLFSHMRVLNSWNGQ